MQDKGPESVVKATVLRDFGFPVQVSFGIIRTMLNDLEKLPDDANELKGLVTLLASELKNRDIKIADLQHQLAGHKRHRFGAKSEGLEQLKLALAEEEAIGQAGIKASNQAGDEAADEETDGDASEEAGQTAKKAKPKRKPLPGNLPRNEQVLSPGESCRQCGGSLKQLGEDVTEELEYIPGRFVVNRFVRPRMACSCCEAIVQSPLPSRPIERGRPILI